jgi:hypothetical protein
MEELQAQSAVGQIDAATFEARRSALTVQGPEGGYWCPGGGETWYWYDGSAWVQRDPPLVAPPTPRGAAPPPARAPVSQPAPRAPAQTPAAPRARQRRWLWVVLAGAIIVLGTALALVLWAGSRWLGWGQPAPATATMVAQLTAGVLQAPSTTPTTAVLAATATPVPPRATTGVSATPAPTPGAVQVADLGLSRADPLPRGARVQVPGWDLQVLDVLRGDAAWQRIVADDADAAPPPEGKAYVVLRLRARCTQVDAYSHSLGVSELYVTGSALLAHEDLLQDVPGPELVFMDFYTAEQWEGWMEVLIDEDEHDLMLVLAQIPWGADPRDHVRYVALDEGASLTVPDEVLAVPRNDLGLDLAQPAPLGEVVISEDWEIAVLEALHGAQAWAFVQELSARNDPPAEGTAYTMLEVRVRNVSADDGARRVSLADFFAVASDGSTYETPRIRSEDRIATFWRQRGLFPGGAHQGWVPLQIPVEDEGAVLRFAPREPSGEVATGNTRFLDLGR